MKSFEGRLSRFLGMAQGRSNKIPSKIYEGKKNVTKLFLHQSRKAQGEG